MTVANVAHALISLSWNLFVSGSKKNSPVANAFIIEICDL